MVLQEKPLGSALNGKEFMVKDKLTRLLLSLVMVGVLMAPTGFAIADAGDYSGDTDYSSSDDGGSSSSDWSSSDSSDSSYYSDSDSSSSSGGGGFSFIDFVIGAIVVIVIIGFVMRGGGNGGNGGGNGGGGAPVKIKDTFDSSKVQNLSGLKERDPEFSESEMQETISNLYIRMQNAWTDKNFAPMEPFFSDGLYAQFNRQLQSLVRNGRTNYVERIAVLGVELQGWYQDGDQDCLVAQVRTRIVDYTVEDASGNVVSGSKDKERFMTYRWILSRTAGVSTGSGTQQINCPNCGGVVDVNKSAACPYCGSILQSKQHDWVISAIQGLSQQTR